MPAARAVQRILSTVEAISFTVGFFRDTFAVAFLAVFGFLSPVLPLAVLPLFFGFFARCQLPIADPLVVGVPAQPSAGHAVFLYQMIDYRRPAVDLRVVVLVHIFGLHDLLRAVSAQEGE